MHRLEGIAMLRAARTLTILLVGACTATVQGQPGSPPAAPPNVVPGASAPPPPTPNKYVPPEKIDGETLDQWILKLDNRDPQVRELAIHMLPWFGPAASKAIPKLIKMMG